MALAHRHSVGYLICGWIIGWRGYWSTVMALSRAVFALKATAVTYFAQSLFGSVVGVVMLSWFIALLLAHQFAETVPAARALVDGVNKTMSGFLVGVIVRFHLDAELRSCCICCTTCLL